MQEFEALKNMSKRNGFSATPLLDTLRSGGSTRDPLGLQGMEGQDEGCCVWACEGVRCDLRRG